MESSIADQLEWPHRIVLPVGDTPANVIRWSSACKLCAWMH